MINFLSPSRTFRPPLHVPCESCPLPLPGCGEVCSPSAPYLPSATSPLLQWRWREPPSFDCCYGRAATRHQNLREREKSLLPHRSLRLPYLLPALSGEGCCSSLPSPSVIAHHVPSAHTEREREREMGTTKQERPFAAALPLHLSDCTSIYQTDLH
jgi:hypothetical protein